MKYINVAFLLVMILLVGCQFSGTESEKKVDVDQERVIANISDQKISLNVSENTLKELAAEAYNGIPTKDEIAPSFFNEATIQGNNDSYYLIAKGKNKEEQCLSVATKLGTVDYTQNKNKFSLTSDPEVPGEKTHTCEGDPCSNCDFTYQTEQEEEIDGCVCSSSEGGDGHCNHSVTSG